MLDHHRGKTGIYLPEVRHDRGQVGQVRLGWSRLGYYAIYYTCICQSVYICLFTMFMYTFVYIYICIHYIGMLYMLFPPLINIIFGISISNSIGISNIYAKKQQEISVGPQVNIYRKTLVSCRQAPFEQNKDKRGIKFGLSRTQPSQRSKNVCRTDQYGARYSKNKLLLTDIIAMFFLRAPVIIQHYMLFICSASAFRPVTTSVPRH